MTKGFLMVAVVVWCASGAACNSATGGTDGGGGGGSGGSGGAISCPTGPLNGSCRNRNDIECVDYAGLPSTSVATLAATCEEDEIGTWTPGVACSRTGAPGGCREAGIMGCRVTWKYTGTAAAAMQSCADDQGTWVGP